MTSVSVTAAAAKTCVAAVGAILLAHHSFLLATMSMLIAAIYIGVVLPCVWSAKPERRAAALATLNAILSVFTRIRR